MNLIDKLKPIIESIQFGDNNLTYITIKFPKEWIVVKNPNFIIEDVDDKKILYPTKTTISLEGCLQYLNQIYDVNQEILLKKQWVKIKIEELKELASNLTLLELESVIITSKINNDDEFIFEPKISEPYTENEYIEENNKPYNPLSYIHEKEPDFIDGEILDEKKFKYNPDTGDMEEV